MSVDGTRIAGNASPEVNLTFEQIAMEIVGKTVATAEAEDEELGDERGVELPEQLRTPEGRREFFRQARRQLQPEQEPSEPGVELGTEPCEEVPLELDAEEIVGRGRQGRDAWLREGKRQLEQHRWEAPDPVSRSREERLLLAAERLENALDVERRANEAHETYRAQGWMKDDRRFGRPPNPHQPPEVPAVKVNITDPDSRPIAVGFGFVCRATTPRPRSTSSTSCWRPRSPTSPRTSRSQPSAGRRRGARRARPGGDPATARSDRCRCRLLERATDGRGRGRPAHPGVGRAR